MHATKQKLTSETGLIIEAILAISLMRWIFGFEITVMGALAVIAAHIIKLSWFK
jgi:hypothetical protein